MTKTRQENVRPAAAGFVLPKPPRPHGDLRIDTHATGERPALLRRVAAALPLAGARWLQLLECQDLFLAELRAALRAMDETVGEESRARMKARLRGIGEVLDWCETVQADLQLEGRRAAAGEQVVELRGLCDDVAHDLAAGTASVPVPVEVHGCASSALWGLPVALANAVTLAVEVAAERIGGQGSVAIEVEEDDLGPHLRVRGLGDPIAQPKAMLVDRFRQAAAAASVAVLPDALGAGGTGMVLRFPAHGVLPG